MKSLDTSVTLPKSMFGADFCTTVSWAWNNFGRVYCDILELNVFPQLEQDGASSSSSVIQQRCPCKQVDPMCSADIAWPDLTHHLFCRNTACQDLVCNIIKLERISVTTVIPARTWEKLDYLLAVCWATYPSVLNVTKL